MIPWLLKRWPWAGAVLLGLVIAAKVWWDRWRNGVALDRETARADREDARADRAEDTAAATTEAIERREAGAATEREVIDAATEATAAHPEDPDAAGAAADEFARRRHRELRDAAARAAGGDANPLPRDPASQPPAGRRER